MSNNHDDSVWKDKLSPEKYRITRQHGTERAFTGKFHNHKAEGTYTCTCCGEPLFDSTSKFDSGCGWPSFFVPKDDNNIDEVRDTSFGMIRTEILCSSCGAHLGHVFNDGPQPTGLRYCVNSASLNFVDPNGNVEEG